MLPNDPQEFVFQWSKNNMNLGKALEKTLTLAASRASLNKPTPMQAALVEIQDEYAGESQGELHMIGRGGKDTTRGASRERGGWHQSVRRSLQFVWRVGAKLRSVLCICVHSGRSLWPKLVQIRPIRAHI